MSLRIGSGLLRHSRVRCRSDHISRLAIKARLSSTDRKWSTALAKNIAQAIATTGPISIATYMRQCLTSLDGGYYTFQSQDRDPFGQKGDFTTSPEVSQIFGELFGIWLVAEWMAQGQLSRVDLVELGPGRGTLMDDMLRTLNNFKPLMASLESIFLVETSPGLREIQRHLLCGDAPFEEVDIGFRSTCKYSRIPITWCEDLRFVPNDPLKAPFIFAHEFFDALPIHAFQSMPSSANGKSQVLQTPTGPLPLSKQLPQPEQPQWRELVVTPTTFPSKNFTAPETAPDFQLSIAKASTSSSLLLPNLSQRYKALASKPESIIEISPESHSYSAELARRIGGPNLPSKTSPSRTPQVSAKPKPSGAALIIDYGPASTVPTSTLRGIRSHELVSPFSFPGQVDISADVDFLALSESALEASPGIEIHGPMEQGAWLGGMGIKARADMLCNSLKGDEDGKKRIENAHERLVERGGGAMGKLYKVMAFVPERGGKRPVGFGGTIE